MQPREMVKKIGLLCQKSEMVQNNLLISDKRLPKFDNIYRLIEDSPKYGAKTH